MNIWARILKWKGWNVSITAPRRDKCVICVAPHTSNIDFFLGICAYYSIGRRANFLMKEFWFFFPLGYLLRAMGGIPVPKRRGSDLTSHIVEMFKERDYVNLAVTPEGTRARTDKWRKGFLYIAHGAGVPIQLGVIDFPTKSILIEHEFMTTGDVEADMAYVKRFYKQFEKSGKHPDNFSAD